jgi:hypothetical protein
MVSRFIKFTIKCPPNLDDINRMYKVAKRSFQEKQMSSSSANSCVQRVRLVLLTQDGPQRVRSSLDLCPGCTELPFVNTGRSTPASRTIPIAPPASDVAAATTQMNGSAISRPSPRTVRTKHKPTGHQGGRQQCCKSLHDYFQ